MNPTTNRMTPSSAKTTAATKFEPRLSKTVISFSPSEGGAQVHVMWTIGAGIVAHGARDVLDLGDVGRAPPPPFRRGRGGQDDEAQDEVQRAIDHSSPSSSESSDVVTHGWSLSFHRLYSKFTELNTANATGTASSTSATRNGQIRGTSRRTESVYEKGGAPRSRSTATRR